MANIAITVQDANNITLVTTPTPTQVITIDRGVAGPVGPVGPAGPGGTVTSVAATVPAFLSVAGSPITTSGTLAIGLSGAALPVLNGGTGSTTATGTGAVVLANSPTLVTPALGTPSALVGTNITGTAAGLTAGNVTTNANLTGAVTSVGNAASLGSFTSAQLLAALTNETGTGVAVFATTPTLVTPVLGSATATSIVSSGTVASKFTITSGTAVPLTITNVGTGNSFVVEDSASTDASPFVIDASGRVVVGNTAITTTLSGITPALQVVGTDISGSAIGLFNYSATANGPFITGAKSRSSTIGTETIVQSGDNLLTLRAFGSDGAAPIQAAQIRFEVDGTPGLNDMPGRLIFSTTADGASTLTERLRIDSAGLTSATGTFSVTGVSTLTGGAVIQGLTVGLGAGAQSNNTAIGVSALSSITTGNSNTGVGWNACATVAVTGHNTGIGNEALKLNLTGSQNTAVGSGAFAINTSGSSNTGLGYVAGQNCTGATNTFLGYFSGAGVSTGSNNVILGSYQGGAAPISGSGSNYIVLSDGAGTVRQTIDPSGNAQFPTGAVVMYAPAPASFAALATLTNADLQTQLIVTTGTSFTLTMPLGSTLDSLISWTGNDLGYDFSVINTASSTITMAVNTGVTFVGRLSVTTQVSGRFRIRRTAASTYIVYRIG